MDGMPLPATPFGAALTPPLKRRLAMGELSPRRWAHFIAADLFAGRWVYLVRAPLPPPDLRASVALPTDGGEPPRSDHCQCQCLEPPPREWLQLPPPRPPPARPGESHLCLTHHATTAPPPPHGVPTLTCVVIAPTPLWRLTDTLS